MEKRRKIVEIDGKNFYYSFLAGSKNLFDNQNFVNKINVFPIPDADTGTNLASTFQSIIDNVIPSNHIKNTADAIADAAIVGARGNSGIILAQFLFGFSNELADSEYLSLNNFAQHIKKAVTYAYESIANPIEGTMITVLKDWGDSIYMLKDSVEDFIELLNRSYQRAKESLAETTQKLKILEKYNVVDAGAQGFVFFLEGMINYFKDGNLKKLATIRNLSKTDIFIDTHEEVTYRYCTEALFSGENLNKELFIKQIEKLGDSIVIAGSSKKIRLHIHTDQAAEVFRIIAKDTTILSQKVDDMVFQNDIQHNRKWNIALATDSCADIPQALIEKYQIHSVPLTLHVGKNQYIDKITITPTQFYDILRTSPYYPTSSQPGKKEFLNKYLYLTSHYESIIAINLSAKLSSTYNNSFMAAHVISHQTGKQISVFDCKTLSGTQGLLLLRIAKAIETGLQHAEILPKIDEWIGKTKLFVNVKTLKYFIKGGRVSPLKGFISNILNVKPIVSVDQEGNAIVFNKSFSRKASINKTLSFLKQYSKEKEIHSFCILYANKEEEENAKLYARKVTTIIGKQPEYIESISPVIGVSAGIGTIAVAIMFE
ncbi:MAG: DegV family EDD domain-containing protein [Bacteroidetes bacterium]|nr:DegV family EDD domain-containing protein [Bacteroidota bacterium]